MRIVVIGILLLLVKPVFAFEYHGDGNFTDNGMSSGFGRYRLVLPPVNLCEEGDYLFFIGELPAEALFLDIEYIYSSNISENEANRLKNIISCEVISLDLVEFKNKKVIYSYKGNIYESGHDEQGKYWRKGFPGAVNQLYNKIVFRVEDVSFEKGFFWQRHSAKQLIFSVILPRNFLPSCTANFVVSGGGWK